MACEIQVSPLTPNIGAEVTGVDLSNSLSAKEADALYEILMEHQVIFLRDQELSPRAPSGIGAIIR